MCLKYRKCLEYSHITQVILLKCIHPVVSYNSLQHVFILLNMYLSLTLYFLLLKMYLRLMLNFFPFLLFLISNVPSESAICPKVTWAVVERMIRSSVESAEHVLRVCAWPFSGKCLLSSPGDYTCSFTICGESRWPRRRPR